MTVTLVFTPQRNFFFSQTFILAGFREAQSLGQMLVSDLVILDARLAGPSLRDWEVLNCDVKWKALACLLIALLHHFLFPVVLCCPLSCRWEDDDRLIQTHVTET